MNAQQFEQLIGSKPEQDDLDRVNCRQAGLVGHIDCGVCTHCGFPRFIPKVVDGELICSHRTRPTTGREG